MAQAPLFKKEDTWLGFSYEWKRCTAKIDGGSLVFCDSDDKHLGRVQLKDAVLVVAGEDAGKHVFIIATEATGQQVELACNSGDEVASWIKALNDHITGKLQGQTQIYANLV